MGAARRMGARFHLTARALAPILGRAQQTEQMLKQLVSALRTATDKKQSLATLIGLWEILGGLLGMLLALRMFGSVDDSLLPKLLWGFVLGGCVLSVLAGLALIRGLPLGRYLSFAIQALQLTQFSFGWCVYDFVIGSQLQFGFTNQGRIWGNLVLGPHFTFQLGGSSPPFAAFNLLAWGACFYLVAISNADLSRIQSVVAS